ncbi:hypothetical protein KDI_33790 [Dictyobacter arantiisoli]|uniref:Uncharacterized protein n=1 Tax=Dictyobacter arantiisoli TaxID=2014874 RepID=A0A5A5TF17_9CHLR|nr:hypothetical protein KDI_33790 [Dictyobacter arantiisoli]
MRCKRLFDQASSPSAIDVAPEEGGGEKNKRKMKHPIDEKRDNIHDMQLIIEEWLESHVDKGIDERLGQRVKKDTPEETESPISICKEA